MIGGIVRVSTKAQGDSQSPENQRQVLAAAGATVFFEAVESGYKSKRRESLEPLFKAIRTRQINKLLATDLSRAARSQELLTELIKLCDEHGVEFLAGGMAITHGDAYQWFSAQQLQLQAELYSRDLQGRIKRGQAAAISRGVFGFTSSHIAWHLQRDPDDKHKVVARPECWDDARQACLDYIGGRKTMSAIANAIYEKHGVMKNTAAANKWFKSHWLRGHYGKRGGPVLIANLAPALLSEEEFEALQRRMKANAKRPGSRAPHKIRALTGLALCSNCGRPMTYNAPKAGYTYLRCGRNDCSHGAINVQAALIEHDLQAFIGINADRIAAAEMARKSTSKPSKELINLKQRIKALQGVLALADSPGVRSDLVEAKTRLEQLQEAESPAAVEELSLWESIRVGSVQWWEERDDQQRQTAYLTVIEHVVVDAPGKKAIEVKFRHFDNPIKTPKAA